MEQVVDGVRRWNWPVAADVAADVVSSADMPYGDVVERDPVPPAWHALFEPVLLRSRCGLCTDIDGTISHMAETVTAATITPEMRALLVAAIGAFDLVATISGRSVASQCALIDVGAVWHVGHHGYEWQERAPRARSGRRVVLWRHARPYVAIVAQALDEIEADLGPRVRGLWMERKGVTGGVHWRRTSDPAVAGAVCMPVVERVARAYGLRLRGGKLGVELFPPMATDKGAGLDRLVRQHRLDGVIYFGDDLSDTDAFRRIRALRERGRCAGVAVGVGGTHMPAAIREAADLLVDGPTGVAHLVRWLIAMRRQLSRA